MKYMGSKNRIAKHILPIILKNRKPEQWYVEPFVGGANSIDKVDGNRIGSDYNEALINALILIRDDAESLPTLITETEYKEYKKNKHLTTGIIGYVGFAMSFGGKWYGGYRRDKAGTKGDIHNMMNQSRRSRNSAIKQSKKLQNVIFKHSDYKDLEIPENSIIYCDPPYKNTTNYKSNDFNHDDFWEWCRVMTKKGHEVFISEYNAPEDFISVWQKEIANTLDTKTVSKPIEKLFIYPYEK